MNNVLAGLNAFKSTYGMTRGVLQDMDMREIAEAKESDNSQFTEDQGKQLEDAANGGAEVTFDEGKRAYVITPQDGSAPQTVEMAKNGVTFLGKDYDAQLSESQRDMARMQAMAGVYAKYGDPMKAMEMKAKAQQGDLTDLQIKSATRQNAREDKADADAAAIEEIDRDVADWSMKRLVNPDGTQREMTTEDQMAAGQYRVSKLVAAGRLKDANAMFKDNLALTLNKIQVETAERNQATGEVVAGIAAGNYQPAISFYDKFIPDGAKVVSMADTKDGKIRIERETLDGRRLPPDIKSREELAAGIQALTDPKALANFSMNEFTRALHLRQEGRAAAADARSAAAHAAGVPARENAMQAAKLQAVLAGTADPAERARITQQINDLTGAGGTDANAPSEVKLANAALKAGLHTDMKSALEWATKSKDLSPDKMRFEIYKTALTQSMGDATKAKEITDQAMSQFGGGGKPAGRQVGAEQVIQSGPNKGKTAVWDGQGWKLKG